MWNSFLVPMLGPFAFTLASTPVLLTTVAIPTRVLYPPPESKRFISLIGPVVFCEFV